VSVIYNNNKNEEKKMKKLFMVLLASLFVAGSGSFVSAAEIKAQGSDTTSKLVQALADAYKADGGDTVSIQGGGSSVGAKACLAGDVELAFLSRGLKDDEKSGGLVGVSYAKDGVAVVVNKANVKEDVTIEELKAIFTGTKTAWDNNDPIMAFNRNTDSGTRELFQEKILGKGVEFGANAAVKHDAALIPAVTKIPTSIGYTSIGELAGADVKVLKIGGIAGTEATVKDGTYALAKTLTFATKGTPSVDVQKFIDFVLSEKGQKIIAEKGFVSIK